MLRQGKSLMESLALRPADFACTQVANRALPCCLIDCLEMLTVCIVTASHPADADYLIGGHSRACCKVMLQSKTAKAVEQELNGAWSAAGSG